MNEQEKRANDELIDSLKAPHAETLRLLEACFKYLKLSPDIEDRSVEQEARFLCDEIRAHLAAMKGTT